MLFGAKHVCATLRCVIEPGGRESDIVAPAQLFLILL